MLYAKQNIFSLSFSFSVCLRSMKNLKTVTVFLIHLQQWCPMYNVKTATILDSIPQNSEGPLRATHDLQKWNLRQWRLYSCRICNCRGQDQTHYPNLAHHCFQSYLLLRKSYNWKVAAGIARRSTSYGYLHQTYDPYDRTHLNLHCQITVPGLILWYQMHLKKFFNLRIPPCHLKWYKDCHIYPR